MKEITNHNSPQHYSAVAMFLHWSIAAIVGLNIISGPLSYHQIFLFSNQLMFHKQCGVIVFLLVVLRIMWRISHQYPSLKGHIPASEELLAKFGVVFLYFLMLAVPFTGLLLAQGHHKNVTFWGHPAPIIIPSLGTSDVPKLVVLHNSLALVFVTLIVGHTIAALKHHFIDKSSVLTRILPQRFCKK